MPLIRRPINSEDHYSNWMTNTGEGPHMIFAENHETSSPEYSMPRILATQFEKWIGGKKKVPVKLMVFPRGIHIQGHTEISPSPIERETHVFLPKEELYGNRYQRIFLPKMNENLPANPYESILPETEDQVGDDQSPRVRLILDPSISHSQVDVLRYHPRKDWRDSPGNISIVHNGYDFLLIWAASYDGKPVREKKTTKIITLSLSKGVSFIVRLLLIRIGIFVLRLHLSCLIPLL